MIEKTLVVLLYTGLLTGSFSTYAFGQRKTEMSFENLDTNSDGKVSLQEFTNKNQSRRRSPQDVFKKLDIDVDVFIDQQEYNARPRRQGGRR